VHTVRVTFNLNEALLAEVVEAHPGVTKTALVEEGLRALLAKRAAARLAALGGTARAARRTKRSAWKQG
jgi:Arc/MetJ family transcription regulator